MADMNPLTETVVRPAVDPKQFRSLMATYPAGVAIVTTTDLAGRPWGMTCSSVCSVALQPPTLLVCLRIGSRTLAAMLKSRTFAVNLLHDRAETVAELFASGAIDRFEKVRWIYGPAFGGPHLIEDAHTIGDCRISQASTVGDHIVVFGQVFEVQTHAVTPPSPLLYGMRQYWSLDINSAAEGWPLFLSR
jgi:flavin reductase (DIM6/NTAB) family NADH-FMN oxidoreductase RutF